MWRLAVGEESRVNDPNTRTAEVLGQVLNLEPRTEHGPPMDPPVEPPMGLRRTKTYTLIGVRTHMYMYLHPWHLSISTQSGTTQQVCVVVVSLILVVW